MGGGGVNEPQSGPSPSKKQTQFLVLVTSERGCDWVKAQCRLCSDWWWADSEEAGGGADMGGKGKERENMGGVLLRADTMWGE